MRSSACGTLSRFCARHVLCWFAFPPVPALRSTGSATSCPALFAGFVATIAESDFSGSCIIGFDSSSSRCGPTLIPRWPNPRSPDSRTKSVHTCQGLRPRRVGRALAMTPPSMLPSVLLTTSAPETFLLSRLNGWPMRSPTDASPTPSRMPTHGSGPMRIATPSPWWTLTSYSLPVFIDAPKFNNFGPPESLLKMVGLCWRTGAGRRQRALVVCEAAPLKDRTGPTRWLRTRSMLMPMISCTDERADAASVVHRGNSKVICARMIHCAIPAGLLSAS